MGVLDWFRIAAAFLVTAIHISPLEDISAQGDLVLTRILARVAVPFFFMVTGCRAVNICTTRKIPEIMRISHILKTIKQPL